MDAARARGWIAALVPLGLLAALAWRSITDLDFGIHMASGRWIAENGRVPETDPFTWTVARREYVAYHWLFQLGLAEIQRGLGVWGVSAARWLALVATGLLLADVFRVRRVSPLAGAAVGTLAVLASEWRFGVRPELASYLLGAATLWVVERHRQGRASALWALPLIQLLWVNTHVYVLGWGILLPYLANEARRRRSLRSPLFAWSAAAGLAVFANPYHVRAVLHPLTLATRMGKENVFAQYVTELASPFSMLPDPALPFSLSPSLLAYWALLALGAVVLLLRARRGDLVDAGVIALFGILSTLAVRNTALYAVLAAPAIASGVDELASRLPASAPARRRLAALGLAAGAGFSALTATRAVLGGFYASQSRPERFETGVCRHCLAVDAADWIADHALRGRGFNNLNMGATLMWRDPARKVFIDGRNEVTGEKFFRRYLKASLPERWDLTVDRFRLQYAVLAHRHDRALSARLFEDPGWTLVYADGSAAVFVRADGPNRHLPAATLPAALGADERAREMATLRADGSGSARLRRWLGTREPPLGDAFGLGLWLMHLRQLDAAERPLIEAARAHPGAREAHHNLAVLYYRMRDWDAALAAFERLRAIAPGDPALAYEDEARQHRDRRSGAR